MPAATLTPRSLRHTAPSRTTATHALALDVGGELRLFELRRELIRLGRGHRADLCFDDPTVSRRHALVLSRPDGTVELIDEGSLCGTFVNGALVERQALRHGDVIRVGRTELRFLAQSFS